MSRFALLLLAACAPADHPYTMTVMLDGIGSAKSHHLELSVCERGDCQDWEAVVLPRAFSLARFELRGWAPVELAVQADGCAALLAFEPESMIRMDADVCGWVQ